MLPDVEILFSAVVTKHRKVKLLLLCSYLSSTKVDIYCLVLFARDCYVKPCLTSQTVRR